MMKETLAKVVACVSLCLTLTMQDVQGQIAAQPLKAVAGDSPADSGPLAKDLSSDLKPAAIEAAMRKVGNWQASRIADTPSQDWTFATLYLGLLSASRTLHDPTYHDLVFKVATHYDWTLGPRKQHADDQAIGQSYLDMYRESHEPHQIAATRAQFDEIMNLPDNPAKPVWWWCDALFMAPPVWAGLSEVTHDPKYLNYMNHEWQITDNLLWDPQEHLFSRDAGYLNKYEKNGRKLFWSRGNGWVMGGLVQVLEHLPQNDPHRTFYENKLREMAAAIAKIQSPDGLWRPGLLDADSYPLPETSGSAFFVYALAWGINHKLLDPVQFEPVMRHGWAGLLQHVYSDGRLGCVQPVGEAPGAYTSGTSYVFGVGAFLLAGSELDVWARQHSSTSARLPHHRVR